MRAIMKLTGIGVDAIDTKTHSNVQCIQLEAASFRPRRTVAGCVAPEI